MLHIKSLFVASAMLIMFTLHLQAQPLSKKRNLIYPKQKLTESLSPVSSNEISLFRQNKIMSTKNIRKDESRKESDNKSDFARLKTHLRSKNLVPMANNQPENIFAKRKRHQ